MDVDDDEEDVLDRERERGPFAPTAKALSPVRLERKASLEMEVAINHSSLSPDGKWLVAVGDSNQVFFFAAPFSPEGEYTLVHTVLAAEDHAFSSDFSRNSHTCAVASQDGIVTLFDMRRLPMNSYTSSYDMRRRHHLATFMTTFDAGQSLPPRNAGSTVDPFSIVSSQLTGRQKHARNAARKVKFSPGASVELLAFTEVGAVFGA